MKSQLPLLVCHKMMVMVANMQNGIHRFIARIFPGQILDARIMPTGNGAFSICYFEHSFLDGGRLVAGMRRLVARAAKSGSS